MAKKRKKKRIEEEAEVPLSAMIDVTFLLLTYFIMTQTEVIEEAYIAMNMVAPNPGPPPEVKPTIFDIKVFENDYVVQGRAFKEIDSLGAYLANFARETQGAEITIDLKLQGRAKTKRLVDLLDILAKEGLEKKINIAFLQ
ncbi:biopolymer transporter ExbD [Lentisphaera marina]|uniref:ExbD/TolR family protein n=1 Tax=Lentisphaera marina TaxID=1111041 RepID=UPI00236683B2|nr:biopolymer transporter ExbD [Lentisphaera marina]MDD7986720.1 biopolymer transporter ExbD [Lentisphaera marina]